MRKVRPCLFIAASITPSAALACSDGPDIGFGLVGVAFLVGLPAAAVWALARGLSQKALCRAMDRAGAVGGGWTIKVADGILSFLLLAVSAACAFSAFSAPAEDGFFGAVLPTCFAALYLASGAMVAQSVFVPARRAVLLRRSALFLSLPATACFLAFSVWSFFT